MALSLLGQLLPPGHGHPAAATDLCVWPGPTNSASQALAQRPSTYLSGGVACCCCCCLQAPAQQRQSACTQCGPGLLGPSPQPQPRISGGWPGAAGGVGQPSGRVLQHAGQDWCWSGRPCSCCLLGSTVSTVDTHCSFTVSLPPATALLLPCPILKNPS